MWKNCMKRILWKESSWLNICFKHWSANIKLYLYLVKAVRKNEYTREETLMRIADHPDARDSMNKSEVGIYKDNI